MKEVQFKTGGRRLRIEDLKALQETAIAATDFMKAAGKNFVVSGCKITCTGSTPTPTPPYYHTSITYSISEGIVFLDGKLRKMPAVNSITCRALSGDNLFIVADDDTTGNPITYLDGTTGQQFYIYAAKVVAAPLLLDTECISLQENINYQRNPVADIFFHDFKSAFLNTLVLSKQGGTFDPNAHIVFSAYLEEPDYITLTMNEEGVQIENMSITDDVIDYYSSRLTPSILEFSSLSGETEYTSTLDAEKLAVNSVKCNYIGGMDDETINIPIEDLLTKAGGELEAGAGFEIDGGTSDPTKTTKFNSDGVTINVGGENKTIVNKSQVQAPLFKVGDSNGITQDVWVNDSTILNFKGGILTGVSTQVQL